MKLYTSISEIESEPSLIGYIRPLRRAWIEFDLASVLCVHGTPALYKKESTRVLSTEELIELHRLFWNQGIASVLLVIDPKTAYIFSGFVSPLRESDALDVPHSPLVVQKMHDEFLEKAIDVLYESVTNGEFYRHYTEKFKSGASVDEYLTANLRALQTLLTKTCQTSQLSEEDAHNFICRLLFACYLVDREIVPLPQTTQKHLHDALIERKDEAALDYLYKFFKSLKNRFNGSMFDQDLDAEKAQLTPDHMTQIKSFLHGDRVGSHQATLGFWAYDFKLIPVETISGIYENFLGWEDKTEKGAYYTPRFLAEMTLDIASEHHANWTQLRYLDPCCGSGIFLVSLFNRLATAWELNNRQLEQEDSYYAVKADALLNILRTQIRGMDQKKSACILACFSLYIALLDSFDPADIKTYIEVTGHKLPKLFLQEKAPIPSGDNFIPVICEGNTLTSSRFELEFFDVAIGNPPWVDRGKKQLALEFLLCMDKLLKPTGYACLLLPSKIFLNIQTDAFQVEWLETHTLERVVQLADFRKILFPEAKCPCMVVRYRQGSPADDRHAILYDTPKFNVSARRQGLIAINTIDRKSIPQGKILWLAQQKKAHIYWKRFLWGTARDQRLLEYLEQFPKLEDRAGSAKTDKPWKKGQGVQLNTSGECSTPKTPWWSATHNFISAKAKSLKNNFFLFQEDCVPVGETLNDLRRATDNHSIFTPPLVLISQGFGKVVFCDFPVLYLSSLQGVHGPVEDKPLLLFLTAYLRSDLAKYYCFHTTSTWGIERDVVRFDELLKLPFPLPDCAPAENAAQIVQQVAKLMQVDHDELQSLRHKMTHTCWLELRQQHSEALQHQTNELVYRYFDIMPMERWLIEDTIAVFEPSSTPLNIDTTDLPTLRPIDQTQDIPGYQNGLAVYADALVTTLNTWAQEQNSSWCLQALGGVDAETGLASVVLQLTDKPTKFRIVPLQNNILIKIFDHFSQQQTVLRQDRQIFHFEDKNLHIVRPLSLIHWTRTAALNDADHIFAQIQMMKGASK